MVKRRTSRSSARMHRSWFDEVIAASIVVLLGILLWQVQPKISSVTYRLGSLPETQGELPLSFESSDAPDSLSVSFALSVRWPLWTQSYVLRGDDCVTAVTVNGTRVPGEALAPCRIDVPRALDLGPFLRPGRNTMVADVRDTGGKMGFQLTPSLRDPLLLVLRLSLLVACAILASLLALRIPDRGRRELFILVCVGIGLRVLYADVTPWHVRGNDADGHVEYVQYLLEHGSIPPRGGGWQFYQPPLYYATSAIPYQLAHWLGLREVVGLWWMQILSLFFSIGALLAGTWCACLLFTSSQRRERLLTVAILALFPGYILLAPKINNDTLLHLIAMLTIGCLLVFWRRPTFLVLCTLSVLLGLGILTKLNALPLTIVAGMCLLLHPQLTRRQRIRWGLLGVMLILVLTEWIIVLRALQEGGYGGLVGNVSSLNKGLRLAGGWSSYVTFDAVRVLQYPFNNPWEESFGRGHFLEYLFRSAMFGEFTFAPSLRFLAQSLLFVGTLLTPLAILGLFLSSRRSWKSAAPMLLLFIVVLGAHMAFRARYPFATSQDFRYSPHLLLPMAYGYALLTSFASRDARRVLQVALGVFLVLSAAFIVGVWITETALV